MKFSALFDSLWTNFAHDLAIDLGTTNTKVLVRGKGIVIHEPSIVVQHKKTKDLLAIGQEAKKMVGKTPGLLQVVKPLRDGVISDFDVTEKMLKYFIEKVHHSYQLFPPKIPKPRLVIGIPSGVTEVERKAVIDAALKAGARKVYLIEEPMAAALGAGLPVQEPFASLIVDIGGGTSEIAVISLGGVVVSRSLRIAGNELDEEIIAWAKSKYNLLIGEKTAEEIKINLGNVFSENLKEATSVMRGRELSSGLPREVNVTGFEVAQAILPTIETIVANIKEVVEDTPPELLGDLFREGIMLAGGGSLITGLDDYIAQKIQVPVRVCEDPILSVVRGCGKALEEMDLLEKVRIGMG